MFCELGACCPITILFRTQEDNGQHRHPLQVAVDVDALNNPEPVWRRDASLCGSQLKSHKASAEEGKDCPDRVEAEPVSVGNDSEPYGQQS